MPSADGTRGLESGAETPGREPTQLEPTQLDAAQLATAGQLSTENSLSAGLVTHIRNRAVTQRDLEAAALFALDAYANIAAGSASEPGRILLSFARECCGVPGNDAARNALVAGALCHMLETDDLHRASVMHPGCAVVPAVLALAEQCAAITGRQALTAILWGYEAATRVGMGVGPAHYEVWHNTGTCGPMGSAMAAACLLELDDSEAVDALGNAGTQAAGLWQFLATGAMSKFLHAGRAAEAGVVAAQLAERGFTGAPKILEGRQGLFKGACPDPDPDAVLARLDQPWQLHATSIKPWPCCRHTHGPINAAIGLHQQLGNGALTPDDIAALELTTYKAALDVCDRPAPDNDYAAKFSLQHCIAAALVHGQIGFDSFDAGARAQAAGLAARITMSADAAYDGAYPHHWGCEMVATLRSGGTIRIAKPDAKGDPENPMSPTAMIEKAHGLLRQAGHANPKKAIDALLQMPHGGPPVSLSALLTGRST